MLVAMQDTAGQHLSGTAQAGPSPRFQRPEDPAFHLTGPQKFIPSRPHPITTFTAEPENTRIWNSLKPLRGANRLGKMKLAPASRTWR